MYHLLTPLPRTDLYPPSLPRPTHSNHMANIVSVELQFLKKHLFYYTIYVSISTLVQLKSQTDYLLKSEVIMKLVRDEISSGRFKLSVHTFFQKYWTTQLYIYRKSTKSDIATRFLYIY